MCAAEQEGSVGRALGWSALWGRLALALSGGGARGWSARLERPERGRLTIALSRFRDEMPPYAGSSYAGSRRAALDARLDELDEAEILEYADELAQALGPGVIRRISPEIQAVIAEDPAVLEDWRRGARCPPVHSAAPAVHSAAPAAASAAAAAPPSWVGHLRAGSARARARQDVPVRTRPVGWPVGWARPVGLERPGRNGASLGRCNSKRGHERWPVGARPVGWPVGWGSSSPAAVASVCSADPRHSAVSSSLCRLRRRRWAPGRHGCTGGCRGSSSPAAVSSVCSADPRHSAVSSPLCLGSRGRWRLR